MFSKMWNTMFPYTHISMQSQIKYSFILIKKWIKKKKFKLKITTKKLQINTKNVSLEVDVLEGGVGAYGAQEVVDVCLEAQLADVEGF